MSKHTPGPWERSDRHKTSINAGDKHIAMVNWYKTGRSDDVSGEEHEANVLLILAATEMLATLRHIAGAAMDITCERMTIRNAARAAITKATGEQS
jgi:hypothetical protein